MSFQHISEKTLLEVFDTMVRDVIDDAYQYGEEISDEYETRMSEIRQILQERD